MEEIKALTQIDFGSLFLTSFIAFTGVKVIVSSSEWVIQKLGLEIKWMRQRREERELLIKTTKGLSLLQEKYEESVKQSIKRDEMIKLDILSLTNTVNGIANTLNNMQNKIDFTEMSKLKEQILSYYRKYKDIGEWDEFESDVFWGLYESYISHGGNSFIKEDVEPIMRELIIKK